MAGEPLPISKLPAAGPIQGDELLPIVQSGVTKKATAGAISPTVYIQRFGAVGNGIVDDTAAFQAAINWSAANKQPVLIPRNVDDNKHYVLGPVVDPGGAQLIGVDMPRILATSDSTATVTVNGPNSVYSNLYWIGTGTTTTFLFMLIVTATNTQILNQELHIGNSFIACYSSYNIFDTIWAFETRGTLIHGYVGANHNRVYHFGGRNLMSGVVLDASNQSVGANNGPGWWELYDGHKWVDFNQMTAQQKAAVGNPVTDPLSGVVYQTYGGDIFATTVEAHHCTGYRLHTEQAADSSITINGSYITIFDFRAENGVNAGLSVAGNNCMFVACRAYNMLDGITVRSAFGGFPTNNTFVQCNSEYCRAWGVTAGNENYREWQPLFNGGSPASYTVVADDPTTPTVWRAYRTQGGATQYYGSIRMTGENFGTIYTDHSSGDTPPYGLNVNGVPNQWNYLNKSTSELPQNNVFFGCVSLNNGIGADAGGTPGLSNWQIIPGSAVYRYGSPGYGDGMVQGSDNLVNGITVIASVPTATTLTLTTDGKTPVGLNEYAIALLERGVFSGQLILGVVGAGYSAAYTITGAYARAGGAGSPVVILGSPTITKVGDSGEGFWGSVSVTVTVENTTYFALRINLVNGATSHTINAKFRPTTEALSGNPPV